MSSAHAALPTALLDKMQKILIFELTATNLRGTLRQLTRKELLEEARAASLPEAVRAGGAAAAAVCSHGSSYAVGAARAVAAAT